MDASLLMVYVFQRAQKECAAGECPELLAEHLFLGILKALEQKPENVTDSENEQKEVKAELGRLRDEVFAHRLIGIQRRKRARLELRAAVRERANDAEPKAVKWFLRAAEKRAKKLGRSNVSTVELFEVMMERPTRILRETLPQIFDEAEESDTGQNPGEEAALQLAEASVKIRKMEKTLLSRVRGQDAAVLAFSETIASTMVFSAKEEGKKAPKAIFAFAGPPGVGKTLLAETASEALGLPMKRFDMSEYVTHYAVEELTGSDEVFKNSHRGILTGFVLSNPECILLFDEVEKAHPDIIHLFLQILDAGRLTDRYLKQTVSFVDAIIIFTTNAGRSLYEGENRRNGEVSKEVLLEALRTEINPQTKAPFFPAAICSRMGTGTPILFRGLEAADLAEIAAGELAKCAALFEKKNGVKVNTDPLLPTLLLLREGGEADARNLRASAEQFFKHEIYGLSRYFSGPAFVEKLAGARQIRIMADPDSPIPLLDGLKAKEKESVLFFGSGELADLCRDALGDSFRLWETETPEEVKEALRKEEFLFALAELPRPGSMEKTISGLDSIPVTASYLREFNDVLETVREEEPSMDLYGVFWDGDPMDEDLEHALIRRGMRRLIKVSEDDWEELEALSLTSREIRLRALFSRLAAEHKRLVFQTAPLAGEDFLAVRLRDFKIVQGIRGKDAGAVLTKNDLPQVRFGDIVGMEDAKAELRLAVQYLTQPREYKRSGLAAPKGILLYGPPGTGKTYLAKALACEAGVPFLPVNGSGFVNQYAGSGPAAVRALFEKARRYAPAVVFIDEIDAIGKERRGGESSQAHEETLNMLLSEMDGFQASEKRPVLVVAATNFPVVREYASQVILDPALSRRFDRRILVSLPGMEDRKTYLERLLSGRSHQISPSAVEETARRSVGMSYAQLKSVLEAAMRIASDRGILADGECLDEAFERERFGEKKAWNPRYLERIARHEAGHALVMALGGRKPEYITIVARGGYGGYVNEENAEDIPVYTRRDLTWRIRSFLAGRAAEVLFYGEEDGVSTAAGKDLMQATKLARMIVCGCGMDEKSGLAVFGEDGEQPGERERLRIEEILRTEMDAVRKLLSGHREALERLTAALLEKNKLGTEEIVRILGEIWEN